MKVENIFNYKRKEKQERKLRNFEYLSVYQDYILTSYISLHHHFLLYKFMYKISTSEKYIILVFYLNSLLYI